MRNRAHSPSRNSIRSKKMKIGKRIKKVGKVSWKFARSKKTRKVVKAAAKVVGPMMMAGA
jgi:hypothetical protein